MEVTVSNGRIGDVRSFCAALLASLQSVSSSVSLSLPEQRV